ncbi:MAG: Crp/Fnr family transcriptional regulator [Reyranella sp.]|nr:Crp/Fnr family transcriptional regulator [Reyranella sp.]
MQPVWRAPALPLDVLRQAGTATHCPRDMIIFAQATAADSVYYLEEGLVKIDVASPQGKRAVIGLLGADSFFGEDALAGQPLRHATASTLIASRLLRVPKAAIEGLLHDPVFAQQLIVHLAQRSSRAEENLIDLLFNSTEKRLARALLLLANLDSEAQPVLSLVNQQTLAEIVGTTRPRINHFIGKFRKRGFVSTQGQLRVHSSLAQVMLED